MSKIFDSKTGRVNLSWINNMSQETYIMKHSQTLFKKNRIKLLKFIHRRGIKISENADGCRINLSKLKPQEINAIYQELLRIEEVELEEAKETGNLITFSS